MRIVYKLIDNYFYNFVIKQWLTFTSLFLPDNFLSLLDIVCFVTLYITEGCRIQHQSSVQQPDIYNGCVTHTSSRRMAHNKRRRDLSCLQEADADESPALKLVIRVQSSQTAVVRSAALYTHPNTWKFILAQMKRKNENLSVKSLHPDRIYRTDYRLKTPFISLYGKVQYGANQWHTTSLGCSVILRCIVRKYLTTLY